MRSDHAHFLSLNAAIAKMQSEDYQTPERARQTYNTGQEGSKQDSNEKASKKIYGKDGKVVYASLANLRRSLNKKNKKVVESAELMETSKAKIKGLIAGRKRQADAAADQLANVNKAYLGVTGKPKLGTTHPKTAGTVGKAAQGDDRLIDAGNVFRKQEMIARRKQQNAEWRLKGNKGKDPRNESVETVDEYTELLESVLLALCEELALDPNKLLEDYQTPERAAATRRAVQQAKAMHEYERTSPHTYGKGGRLVKKAKTKRALSAGQKTNAFLKSLYK